MPTTRKQIRDAVIAKIAALPGNTGKVYGYIRKITDTSSHFIGVDMSNGELENGVGVVLTTANVNIAVVSPAIKNIDDTLDGYADAIEAAFDADPSLGGLVTKFRIQGWDYTREITEGMAAIVMTYKVVYRVA